MLEKIANIAKQYHLARRIYQVVKRIDLSHSIPQIMPVVVKKSRFEFKRLNLMIPSINEEHFYGGVSTALKLFEELLSTLRKGIRSRIILTDATPDRNALKQFPDYRSVSFDPDTDVNHQILPIKEKYQKNIYVTQGDRFISTSWWTAYSAQDIIRQQSRLFNMPYPKMGYLIQDYEPGFYNWSTHYMLAESTYRSDIPILAIFNTSILKKYFNNKNYTFEKEFVFEPRLNTTMILYLESAPRQRKKRILLYGRPSVERNCFPLIVEALKRWVLIQPGLEKWEVLSVGEMHKPVNLGNNKILKSLGKLNLEHYSELLLESAIGLSFMISPHPSYPPLEMAHFGLLTITNLFANKDLSACHGNITSLLKLMPETIAEALLEATEKFSADPLIGTKGESFIPDYRQIGRQFPFVNDFIDCIA